MKIAIIAFTVLLGITLVAGLAFSRGWGSHHGWGMNGYRQDSDDWCGGQRYQKENTNWESGCCRRNWHYDYSDHVKIDRNTVKAIAQDYLDRLDNPNLKIGQISELKKRFEVEIVTQDDSLVERMIIYRETGYVEIEY